MSGSGKYVVNNPDTGANAPAILEMKTGSTSSSPFQRFIQGASRSWGLGINTNTPEAGGLFLGWRADSIASPDSYTYLPFRVSFDTATRTKVVTSSSLVVSASNQASGETVLLHAQNTQTAADSNVEFLLESADPNLGAGGGWQAIRWGSPNQIQFSLGQDKDLTPATQNLELFIGGFSTGTLCQAWDSSGITYLPQSSGNSVSNEVFVTMDSTTGEIGTTASAGGGGLTLGTPQATTSGTSFNFGSIPSGTTLIKVMFQGVSLDGTDEMTLQIGDSGGIEATGYVGATEGSAWNTYIYVFDSQTAADTYSGIIELVLMNSSTNLWAVSLNMTADDAGRFSSGAGTKALSGELTQLTISRNGTDNFDAGSVNIAYA